MTHFLVSPDGVLQFSTKEGALNFLESGKRVRISADSRGAQPDQDWSAPRPESTGAPNITAASEGQSSVEVRTP